MNTIDQTFPAFVKSCGDLYSLFLPIAMIILLIGFIHEFWASPPSAHGILKFIIKQFIIILILANSYVFVTKGQESVQLWIQEKIPANPARVAQRYQEQLTKAQNAPQKDKSFWDRLTASNLFESFIYGVLTLIAWFAMALMWFIYGVQRVVLLVCWTVSPLLIPLLAIRPLSYMGLRHILRTIAVMLWPLGLALAATWTDGLIDVAVNQNFLASQSVLGSLGYGLQNLLAVTVIAIWIIFSTIMAPAFIQKMVVGSAGAASVISDTVGTVFGIAGPAVGGAASAGWQAMNSSGDSGDSSSGESGDGSGGGSDAPPPPPGSPPPAQWQPAEGDPTGEQQAEDIANQIKNG